jgi:glycosyltransferase involved in cell wall biosynthesis
MGSKQTTARYRVTDGISIIIPAYNARDWIEPTVHKIIRALRIAKLDKAEIIIIDDGSVDDTAEIARLIKSAIPVHVYKQANKGRFLARKEGVRRAKYSTVFFVDTRVWINEDSLEYVINQQKKHPGRLVWNGNVEVYKKGNIIARFGDAVTRIGWRRYHKKPRLISYTINDFDHYPKGTGVFIVPKKLLIEAIEWFESQTQDIRFSSDDTLLIRYIAERERIWISPGFTSTYFARTTLLGFIKHTYHRGMFFVDGFLRPGTRFYYSLIVFLMLSLVALMLIVFVPTTLPCILYSFGIAWVLELFVALALKLGTKDSAALFLLSPIFALFYGLGIWRAVIRRIYRH